MNIVLHSSFSSIINSLEIYQTFCRKGPQPHPDLIVWTPVISSPALLRTVLFLVSHCCLWGCLSEVCRATSFLCPHSSQWAMPWTPVHWACSEGQEREEGDGVRAGMEMQWGVRSEWQGSRTGELWERLPGEEGILQGMQEIGSMWEEGSKQTGEECCAPSAVAGLTLWKYLLF